MKTEFYFVILLGILFFIFLGFSIGASTVEPEKKEVSGLRFENITGQEAINSAYNYTSDADWVLIDVSNMDYEEMVRVCNHEIAHEIFARECENNITKCMEVEK